MKRENKRAKIEKKERRKHDKGKRKKKGLRQRLKALWKVRRVRAMNLSIKKKKK